MKSLRWWHLVLIVVVVGVVAGGGWYAVALAKRGSDDEPVPADGPQANAPINVEVAYPRPGGIPRLCVQPGTVVPYQTADLYAKVSGYLVEQSVDIGSRVKAGDILARISVPEYEKQAERDEASLRDTKAKVKQMEAHLEAARAESRAAMKSIDLARVMVKVRSYYRSYRKKQLDRVQGLVDAKAESAKLLDEQQDYYQSAFEAENAANEQVNTNIEKAAAAKAKVEQAEADVDEAKAEVGVADATLAKSKVLLKYLVITSPYTGVVTKRNFNAGTDKRAGDFIKAADQGGVVPLLAVERTDWMRVVVQVPDRDVPYVSKNSTATIEIDALPGIKLGARQTDKLHVSRWANAEDQTTRTMRTEIDVPNPDGILVHGMYGRVTITLASGTPNALRIASAALVGKSEGGRGSARIVRDGKVHLVPVRFATDNGVEVEVVSGLTPNDQVIIRSTGAVEEGTPVIVHLENPPEGR